MTTPPSAPRSGEQAGETWCSYCKTDSHNDAECWSTRPANHSQHGLILPASMRQSEPVAASAAGLPDEPEIIRKAREEYQGNGILGFIFRYIEQIRAHAESLSRELAAKELVIARFKAVIADFENDDQTLDSLGIFSGDEEVTWRQIIAGYRAKVSTEQELAEAKARIGSYEQRDSDNSMMVLIEYDKLTGMEKQLAEQAARVKELEAAIKQMLEPLGTGLCSVNECEGCQVEVQTAIHIGNEALKGSTP